MPTIQVSTTTSIYYEKTGEGPNLLFLTGVGYDSWFWHHQVEMLSPYFTILTVDNRGTQRSETPFGPYSIMDMVKDTAKTLEELNFHPTYVMGHSMGGFIAQELALHYSGFVDRLILASTSFGGPNAIPITERALSVLTNREGELENLIRVGLEIASGPDFPEAQPEVFEEIVAYRMTEPVSAEQYQFQVLAGVQHDTAERLHRLDVPTLVLTGEDDEVVPPGNAELLASTLPDVNLLVIPEVGHIFPLEAPELTSKIVYDFLTL